VAKALNDAYFANLYCAIKKLCWSDPGRAQVNVKTLFPGEIFGKAGDNDSAMSYKGQAMTTTLDDNCRSILPEDTNEAQMY